MKLNKRAAVAVTVGVWLAAAGAAAALTYELNRPLHAASVTTTQPNEPKPVVLEPLVQPPTVEAPPVLYLAELRRRRTHADTDPSGRSCSQGS